MTIPAVRLVVLGAAIVAIGGCAALEPSSSAGLSDDDASLDSKAPLLPSALFSGQADVFEAWHCSPASQHRDRR